MELCEAEVPHRGQWVHSGWRGALHDTQARDEVADAVVVGDAGLGDSTSSAWPETAFLNSFMDCPSDRASSGSFLAPNKKTPIPKTMRASWYPNTASPFQRRLTLGFGMLTVFR